MKFKVGDKVKVIAKKHGHGFNIGEIVKIKEINCEDYMCSSLERNNIWWLRDDEVAEVKFTKSDLKDGDIVTYRNGDKRTVIAGNLINSNGYISKKLNQYTNELKDTVTGESLDIIKVERPVKYETVFERKEEILDETEKRYLKNVIRPWQNVVDYIEKHRCLESTGLKEYIVIFTVENDKIIFPEFEINTMYRNMKVNKQYSLEELGL